MMNVFLIGVSEPVRKIIDMILSRFEATLRPLDSFLDMSEEDFESKGVILFDLQAGPESEISTLLASNLLNYKNLPIIFLLGEDEKKAALVSQREAFILKKPFTSEELISSISHIGGVEEPLKDSESERVPGGAPFLSSQFEKELKAEVHNLTLQYCREHFAEIAEFVIRQEIKRISSEDFQQNASF